MTKKPAPSASLKSRTILLVLGLLLFSLWTLAIIGGQMLRKDMQALASDQQHSTATVVASQIDLEVSERILALNRVSEAVTAKMLADPAALQSHVEMQPIFRDSFNAGVFATGVDGLVVASYPYTGQIGVSIIDRDYISAVLKGGIPSMGQPVISKNLGFPVFVIAVPIRDAGGRVVGVMAGVTDLSKPNFLDRVTGHAYGKTGGYVVVAAKSRLIVTSRDKRKNLLTLPEPGLNPTIDRLVRGYEGSLIMNDSQGTEVLASAKAVPVAGWYLVATLPTSEAFGPYFKLQRNMWLVTIALTITAGFFTAWLLRGLLAPMLTTVAQLAEMSTGRTPLQPLPMKGPVEIDRLVAGFNQLIGTLKQRENDLMQSAAFSQGILNSIPAEIAVLDRHGVIIGVNRPFHHNCGDTERCNECRPSEVGRNYLTSGLAGNLGLTDSSLDIPGAIRSVLNGQSQNFTVEYPCRLAGATAWYSMSVTPLSHSDGGVVVSHTDITTRKQTQLALEATVREKDALFKEVHHRVKNNLQVINSLLRLESGRSARADTRAVLSGMQGRIRSMAILHELLYRAKSLAAIELGSYLGELATQAFRSLENAAGDINLKMELATINVGMDQALPCGLIVNELISNSFKHGFPTGGSGTIRVELATLDGGSLIRICISDTGIGLPSDFDIEQSNSLGLHLVTDLVEQLDGQLEFATGPGACISVTFSVDDFLLS